MSNLWLVRALTFSRSRVISQPSVAGAMWIGVVLGLYEKR